MGFMATLVGGNDQSKAGQLANYGGHGLSTGSLMAVTDGSAITPTNPGDLTNLRTRPVVTNLRTYTREEAEAIALQTALNEHTTQQTVKAYRNMGKQETLDATVQSAYRNYQGKVAAAEMRKVKSNARLGKQLHGMRGQYAALGYGLHSAQVAADHQVAVLKAKLTGGL